MHLIEEAIAEVRSLFPDWERTVPRKIWPVVETTAYEAPVGEVQDFLEKYRAVGKEWGFHPHAPFVRRILKYVLFILAHPVMSGVGHLETALAILASGKVKRLIMVTNHLSYADANLLATLLQPLLVAKGFENDFSVVVGPKVYNEKFKAFSSLHFNSLLIAQSLAVATKEAVLPLKEIARAAKKVMSDIKEKVRILLIFPEGSRSRTGNMNRFLPGVLKLIEAGDGETVVVPAAILGGEKILPIHDHTLHEARVDVCFGAPILLSEMHARYGQGESSKQAIMDFLGYRVSLCLPPERRGFYADYPHE